jgi:small subunit ribosomal protein S9
MANTKTDKKLITGTGRRKTAVARVFLYCEKGDFTINGEQIETYFASEVERSGWTRPFHVIGVSHPETQFSGTVKISGSGKSAQLGALIHALSHALAKVNDEYAVSLRKQDLLTRDARMVERKKPFLRKARKAPQYSKR